MLRLGSELENAFGFNENLDLIQRLANLSAVALENARLFTQARERATELDAQARRLALVNRIATRLARALTPDEIYQIALNEMQEALGAQYGGVVIYDNPEQGYFGGGYPSRRECTAAGSVHISLVDNVSVATLRETQKAGCFCRIRAERSALRGGAQVLVVTRYQSLMIVPLLIGGQGDRLDWAGLYRDAFVQRTAKSNWPKRSPARCRWRWKSPCC